MNDTIKLICNIYLLFIDDLSKGKPTSQSSTYPGNDTAYRAGNAVDRDVTTCMRTDQIGGNSQVQNVWWRLDLGGKYNVYNVSIMFKNYNGYGNCVSILIILFFSMHAYIIYLLFKHVNSTSILEQQN